MHIYTGNVTHSAIEGEEPVILLLADDFTTTSKGFILHLQWKAAPTTGYSTTGSPQDIFLVGDYTVAKKHSNSHISVKEATSEAESHSLKLRKADESGDEIVVTLHNDKIRGLTVSLKQRQVIERPPNPGSRLTFIGLVSCHSEGNHIVCLSVPDKNTDEKSASLFRIYPRREELVEHLSLDLVDKSNNVGLAARSGEYEISADWPNGEPEKLALQFQKGGVPQYPPGSLELLRHTIFDVPLILPTIITLNNNACQPVMYYVAPTSMHDTEAAINLSLDVVSIAKEGAEAVPGVGAFTAPYDMYKASIKFWFDGIKMVQKYMGDLPSTGFISPGQEKTFWDIDQNFTTGAVLRITIPTFKPHGDSEIVGETQCKNPYLLYTWFEKQWMKDQPIPDTINVGDFFQPQRDWLGHTLRPRADPKTEVEGWTPGMFKFPLFQKTYAQNFHAYRVQNLRLIPDYAEDIKPESKDIWIDDSFIDTISGKIFRRPFDSANSLGIKENTRIGYLSRKDTAFVRANPKDWNPDSTETMSGSPGVAVTIFRNREPMPKPENIAKEKLEDYLKRRAMTFSRKLVILSKAGLEPEDTSDTSLKVEFQTVLTNPLGEASIMFQQIKDALIKGFMETSGGKHNYQKVFWAFDFHVTNPNTQTGKLRGWLYKPRDLETSKKYSGPINMVRKEDGSFVIFMVEHASTVDVSDLRDIKDIKEP